MIGHWFMRWYIMYGMENLMRSNSKLIFSFSFSLKKSSSSGCIPAI